MSTHTSTKRGRVRTPPQDSETLVRFAELLKLRGLAPATQEEYLRFVRKLAAAETTWLQVHEEYERAMAGP